jgi:hypothetical protein
VSACKVVFAIPDTRKAAAFSTAITKMLTKYQTRFKVSNMRWSCSRRIAWKHPLSGGAGSWICHSRDQGRSTVAGWAISILWKSLFSGKACWAVVDAVAGNLLATGQPAEQRAL